MKQLQTDGCRCGTWGATSVAFSVRRGIFGGCSLFWGIALRPDERLVPMHHPLEDPRAVVVPVRRNRFTHHVIIGEAGEIDGQLMAWIDMAKRMK